MMMMFVLLTDDGYHYGTTKQQIHKVIVPRYEDNYDDDDDDDYDDYDVDEDQDDDDGDGVS